MSRRPVRERKPLPGNEIEVEMVKVAALKKLEELEADTTTPWIMDTITSPHRPGLHSESLRAGLRFMAEKAIDAVALLRRLAVLCGEEPGDPAPEIDVTEAEDALREDFSGLTEEEAREVYWAAHAARTRVLEQRRANTILPDCCPKCGGGTYRCKLDGDWRWLPFRKPAPARRCHGCGVVTPNVYPAAKVLSLVKPKPELPN